MNPQKKMQKKQLKQQQKSSFSKIHWSSKTTKHNTPEAIFKELHEEFHFNLDPCNPPMIGKPLDDGLRNDWTRELKKTRAFINPGYERGVLMMWVQKASKEINLGHCELAVFLIPFRNSDFFKKLRKKNAEFRLCDHRIKFKAADKSSNNQGNSAPFDSCIAILQ